MRADEVDPRKPFDFSLFWFTTDRESRPWEECYLFSVDDGETDEPESPPEQIAPPAPINPKKINPVLSLIVGLAVWLALAFAAGAVLGLIVGVAIKAAMLITDIS